jgi:hypothetical protein
MKEDGMDMSERNKRFLQDLNRKTSTEEIAWETQAYNIEIDLKKKIGLESVDLIQVAQGSVQWRTLVNMVMNLGDA